MKTVIALIALVALVTVPGIAVDVRETSWGVPFLAPDPSLKTTDPFYANQGATYIGPIDTASYRLPPVLTQNISKPQTRGDPWMATGPRKSSLTTNLTLAESSELTDAQIDKLYPQTGQISEAAPWM